MIHVCPLCDVRVEPGEPWEEIDGDMVHEDCAEQEREAAAEAYWTDRYAALEP